MDAPLTQQISPKAPSGRSRGISFRSDKSGGSQGKLQESPRDKERRDSIWKGQSKANPNAALREEQPGVKNVLEESTLQNLREIQHKDRTGNLIAEPDLSNPTRPRFERPLDTIRSFEKAIDDGYKRRSTFQRSDSYEQNNQYASRRSSYFGGLDNGSNQNRYSTAGGGGGYYGGQRPDSYANNAGQSRQRYGQRMHSDPTLYGNGQSKSHPQHGYHQSYDTVNTGVTNGSDSTGPWANSTDPSSENSSIDRNMVMNKPSTPGDGYGPYNGHSSHGPIMEEQGYGEQYNGQPGGMPDQQSQHWRQQQYHQGPPPPPPHAGNGGRRPIPLTSPGSSLPGGSLPTNKHEPEKRKSWLKRTFSKNK